MTKKILLGLTTTPMSDWQGKIEEARKYDIMEVALFPTFLGIEERKRLYEKLESSPITSIPHVHLRDDFESWELELLTEKYSTAVFNIHPNEKSREFILRNPDYADRLYVENVFSPDDEFMKTLELCGGLCIDFSHWADAEFLMHPEKERMEKIAKEHRVGCSHASAVKELPALDRDKIRHSCHFMTEMKEMDYLVKYREFLPDLISIELENDFHTQLQIRKYLEEIIL